MANLSYFSQAAARAVVLRGYAVPAVGEYVADGIAIIAPLPIKHLFQMPIVAKRGGIINNLFVHRGSKWYNFV